MRAETVQLGLNRVLAQHADALRSWSILQMIAAYDRFDPGDLDGSFGPVAQHANAAYRTAVSESMTAVDEYMWLMQQVVGEDYVANWRNGQPGRPTTLASGYPFRDWMAQAPPGIKRLISQGMAVEDAIALSRSRAINAAATNVFQTLRETTLNRLAVDALVAAREPIPADLSEFLRDVESYANMPQWDGVSMREPSWTRWRRVPSPGACSFCLMLASRSDYTSADAAMYAGGAEGTQRYAMKRAPRMQRSGVSRRRTSKQDAGSKYHRNCRCTVAMVTGADAGAMVISQEDYDKFSQRDADGRLVPFFKDGKYSYTLDDFDVQVAGPGLKMPDRAPWADAWKSPKKRRGGRDSHSLMYA